jgi:hypothetical protein
MGSESTSRTARLWPGRGAGSAWTQRDRATGPRPRHATLALIAAVALAGTTAVAHAAAKTVVEHASAGGVTATVTYKETPKAIFPYTPLKITIVRDGKTLRTGLVKTVACGTTCEPQETDPVRVLDVESDGAPDVMLDLYSGGAHCCSDLILFRYDAQTGTLTQIEHNFGDPGYRLERLYGKPQYELVSADDRFAYEYAPYVYSGLPLQIWQVRGGRFIDITRSYPKLIAADAATWWKDWQDSLKQGYGEGELAAWAADEYELGNGAQVTAALAAANARHELRSDGFGPSGSAYIKSLHAYLAKTGYITSHQTPTKAG